MPTNLLNHERLGKVRGIISEDGKTIQYRGIKFAEIAGRWQDPVLSDGPLSKNGEGFDATRHGPSCPQHSGGFAFDLSLIGNVKLDLDNQDQSEFDCLTVIVTVPVGVRNGAKLPVFAWVHGGGFSIGSNSWPQYDLAKFVATSVDVGKPVIGVSINYRLGIFGFLTSNELKTSGNLGLKDQACAFKWMRKNIQGFGGDSRRVTAAGESAGSICIATLLLSSEKDLFDQAIIMSGDPTLRRPRRMKWQNSHYATNVSLLDLAGESSDSRRKQLYTMKANDLVQKLPMFQHWSPTVDGSYIANEVNLGLLSSTGSSVGKPNWCTKIMTGDTSQDGSVLKGRIMDNPNIMSRLQDALEADFNQEEREQILKSYNLSGNLTKEQQYKGLLQLSSDLRFYLSVLKVVGGWQEKKDRCYRYHFHQQNPIPGTYQHLASHELDVAYLLQNFGDAFPASHQKLGKQMAEIWIDFTYGKAWEKSDREEVCVIGPNEKINFVGEEEYDLRYRDGRGTMMLEIGWEKCFKLGEVLQGVHEDVLPSKL